MRAVPHGTNYGYTHHGCRCDPCRRAQAEATRRYRANNPDAARRNSDDIKARGRALRALAALHPEEYARLLDAERVLVGLPPVHTVKRGRRARNDGLGGADAC